MAEIISVYREDLPKVRLVGKLYTDQDRNEHGSFANQWGEWLQNDWFAPLEKLSVANINDGASVGCMRFNQGIFEYWIGMFCPEDTDVPDGYSYVDIPGGDIGVTWIKGREDNGEIFGFHNQSVAAIKEKGWEFAENPWFFERYNCPRFTAPDDSGEVILDYCMYLK